MARKITKSQKASKQAAFIEALATGAMIKDAAATAGVPESTAYAWRKADAAFAEAWADAYLVGTGALEAEAQRRAVKGTRKPVFHMGKVVGYTREYSDTLLIFLMKSRDPQRFDDRVRFAAIERKIAADLAKQGGGSSDMQAALAAVEALQAIALQKSDMAPVIERVEREAAAATH